MTVSVLPVDRTDVTAFWPEVVPHLDLAITAGRRRFTLESIRADLIAGKKLLWVAQRHGRVIASIVTVMADFPAQRVCTILLCGGGDLNAWLDQALDRIEHFAEMNQAEVDVVGRIGWHRALARRGYAHAGAWLVKETSR